MATDNPKADAMSIAELVTAAWNLDRMYAQRKLGRQWATLTGDYVAAVADKNSSNVFATSAAIKNAETPGAALTAVLAL